MVDYYPLLARAIARSPDGGEQVRQSIFDCARAALTTQLRNIEPAVPDDLITQEQASLEDAIRRAEAQFSYALGGEDGLVHFDQIRWLEPAVRSDDAKTLEASSG